MKHWRLDIPDRTNGTGKSPVPIFVFMVNEWTKSGDWLLGAAGHRGLNQGDSKRKINRLCVKRFVCELGK